MTSIEELNTAREKLFEGLGEKAKLYFHLMKMWFHMKCTKEKFDFEVRKFMDVKQARLHNQFLLQLLLHCSKPDLPTSSQSYSRLKDKRRKVNNNGGFQQTNVQEFAPTRITQRPPDEPPRYCVQELLLPDYEMILKRLTVGAWELGLKGAERGAAEVLEVAVKHFLKNIISTVLSRRNGFRVDRSVQHAVGIPVSNPWLKNTAGILSSKNVGSVTEDMDTRENMPISRPSFTEQQQDIAVTYAASVSPAKKRPITAIECYEALQRHFHPAVRMLAQHITTAGDNNRLSQIPTEITKLDSVQLFEDFDPSMVEFKPAVPPPPKNISGVVKVKEDSLFVKELEKSVSTNPSQSELSTLHFEILRNIKGSNKGRRELCTK